MIRKVLIATDGSDHATRAVAFGSDIAAKCDAEVLLLHVMMRGDLSDGLRSWASAEHMAGKEKQPLYQAIAEISPGRFPTKVVIPSDDAATIDQVLRTVGDQVLDQAKKVAHEHGVIKVATRIEDRDPATCILSNIASDGIDLVVSGARGTSDLKALLTGSVSHKISHLSPVPYTMVR